MLKMRYILTLQSSTYPAGYVYYAIRPTVRLPNGTRFYNVTDSPMSCLSYESSRPILLQTANQKDPSGLLANPLFERCRGPDDIPLAGPVALPRNNLITIVTLISTSYIVLPDPTDTLEKTKMPSHQTEPDGNSQHIRDQRRERTDRLQGNLLERLQLDQNQV